MKRNKWMMLMVVFFFTLVVMTAPLKAGEKYKLNPPMAVTVSAGSIGGGWFMFSTALFSLFEDYIDGLKYSIVPGGGVANAITMNKKDSLFGMNFLDTLVPAVQGQDPFKEKITNLRGIVNMNNLAPVHCIILKKFGVSTFKEIAEKKLPLRLDTGPRGTSGELAASRVLELHGCGYKNIRAWGGKVTHSSYRDALNNMMDGHMDGFLNSIDVGSPIVIEATQSRDMVLLPLEENILKTLVEKYGYAPMPIPAGTYRGQDKDVPAIAQASVFICHKDAPNELVYQMTKLILSNKNRLVTAYKGFKDMGPETAWKYFPIPLHPGAERYYREIGAMK